MKNAFNRAFDEKDTTVYEGDTIQADIDGFHVVAKIVRDNSPDSPDEIDEGFWPSIDPSATGYIGSTDRAEYLKQMDGARAIMRAWEKDEWFYCGVVLSVSKFVNIQGRTQSEVVISDHAASLWGVECNYPNGGNDYLTTVANDLLPEALEHARECLKQITGVQKN